MHMFEQRFLAARDGDLSPFDSWRRRNIVNGEHIRFEIGFVKPLECLCGDDYEELLLVAAESKATVAWLHARFSCEFEEAKEFWVRHTHEYHAPARHVLGQTAAVWREGGVSIQVALFRPDHKPLEDRRYATIEQVAGMMSQLGYKSNG